jgi:hypothetical protein
MTVRKVVGRALWSDTVLNGLGIVQTSLWSGDVDTPEPRPYMVLRWGDTSVGVGDSRQRTLVLWIHDKGNNYDRIDSILRRSRIIITDIHGARTDTGWITAIDWITDSGDLSDDTTQTILRTSAYNIVASGM